MSPPSRVLGELSNVRVQGGKLLHSQVVPEVHTHRVTSSVRGPSGRVRLGECCGRRRARLSWLEKSEAYNVTNGSPTESPTEVCPIGLRKNARCGRMRTALGRRLLRLASRRYRQTPIAKVFLDLSLASLGLVARFADGVPLTATVAMAPVEGDKHSLRAREILRKELVQVGVQGRHDEKMAQFRRFHRGAVGPGEDPELAQQRLAGGAMGFRFRQPAGPGVGGSEAEVRPPDEGTHAQRLAQPEGSLVAFARLVERRGITADRDFAQKVMRVGFVAALSTGQGQLEGFARRLLRSLARTFREVAFGEIQHPQRQISSNTQLMTQPDALLEQPEAFGHVAHTGKGQPEQRRRDRLPYGQTLTAAQLQASCERQHCPRQVSMEDRNEARQAPGDRLGIAVLAFRR